MRRMPDLVVLRRSNHSQAVIILMTFLIIFMGLRSSGVGGDTGHYVSKYIQMMNGQLVLDENVGDWLFYRVEYLCAKIMPVSMFLLVVEFLYVFLVYYACVRILRNNATWLFLFAMGAFSFFSYMYFPSVTNLPLSFFILPNNHFQNTLSDTVLFDA